MSSKQTNHINMLCDSVPTLARQNCPSLLTQAQQIADRHRESLLLFSSCHNVYQQKYVDGDKAEELCKFGL